MKPPLHINTKLLIGFCLLVLVLAAGYVLWNANNGSGSQVEAVGGLVDISGEDLGKATVLLDGEWRFQWEKFGTPDVDAERPTGFIRLPGVWNGAEYAGRNLPAHGWPVKAT